MFHFLYSVCLIVLFSYVLLLEFIALGYIEMIWFCFIMNLLGFVPWLLFRFCWLIILPLTLSRWCQNLLIIFILKEFECNGCKRGGGELCNKYSNKTTQDLYWFGLPNLRPVLNHPGREFHYNSGFKSGSPETLQPQVLHGITCNLTTSFTQAHL